MVKLFVSNLTEQCDSTKLRQVFQQHTKVTECDVVKNYAFVHIEDENPGAIIKRLDGYMLDGKPIQIQNSTSKLRQKPGMDNKCYRCGSEQHKTPQCPEDPANKGGGGGASSGVTQTIKIDLTGGTKRPAPASTTVVAVKRPYTPPQVVIGMDSEIPQPMEADLQALYQEYITSRSRYIYYKERLQKEIEAKRVSGGASVVQPANGSYLTAPASMYAAHQTYNPSAYAQPQIQQQPAPVATAQPAAYAGQIYAAHNPYGPNQSAAQATPAVAQPYAQQTAVAAPASHPYAVAAQPTDALKAPYAVTGAAPTAPYVQQAAGAAPYAQAQPAPYQQQSTPAAVSNHMTTQQYLMLRQQQQTTGGAPHQAQPGQMQPAAVQQAPAAPLMSLFSSWQEQR